MAPSHCDLYEYRTYMSLLGGDNGKTRALLARNLTKAVKEELTPKQRETLEMYFVHSMTMPEIAEMQGVNVSTVSRSISRGLGRLERCLRYGARELLRQSLEG